MAGISDESLAPFVMDLDQRKHLLTQSNEESDLHLRPLIFVKGEYVVALPWAVTYAIRRYLLRCARKNGQLNLLQTQIMRLATQKTRALAKIGSRHGMNLIPLPENLHGVRGLCRSVAILVGTRRLLHFLLVKDDIELADQSGLLTPGELSDKAMELLQRHIEDVRIFFDSSDEIDSGHTFWLMGHIGQAGYIESPTERANWTFNSGRLYDFELFFNDPNDPADRLILMLNQQARFARQDLEILFQNGILNLYAYWTENSFCLQMPEVRHDESGFIQIATNFLAKYRQKRRAAMDEHCERTLTDGIVIVRRANSGETYKIHKEIPAYISMNHLEKGILSFCLRQHSAVIWMTVLKPEDVSARYTTFKLWEALQLWLWKLLAGGQEAFLFTSPIVEVVLDLGAAIALTDPDKGAPAEMDIALMKSDGVPSVRLVVGRDFLKNFMEVENKGEQLVLTRLTEALILLAGTAGAAALKPEYEAMRALGGVEARAIHVFRSDFDVDSLIYNNPNPVYRFPTEDIEAAACNAFSTSRSVPVATTFGVEESISLLNSAVERQMATLKAGLIRLDRMELIESLMALHETLLRDDERWRSTARAVRALYGQQDGTEAAREAENKRVRLQVPLRALIEAAICESPLVGGRPPDGHSIDELVGTMHALIDLGRESDLLYFGLATSGITIHPNGSHGLDSRQFMQLAAPYIRESFNEKYSIAAADYENWVGKADKPVPNTASSVFSSAEFLHAWNEEYGISFDSTREILGELQNLAVARQTGTVSSALKELARRLKDQESADQTLRKFLSAFALRARPTWVATPPYGPKDIKPWRFQRRLSLMLRPLVQHESDGDVQITYGVGTLRNSFAYLFHCITEAAIDKDVFASKSMRAFIGKRADSQGKEFEAEVAASLESFGWRTRTTLKLTELGAPRLPDMGDIDVLAWNSAGHIMAIECKRLRPSRTIQEIARTCDRFRGNVGDKLARHIRRGDWVKQNLPAIARFTKLPQNAIRIHCPLVVSAPVPFKYIEDLPMPAKDIVSFHSLKTYTEALIR